MSQSENPEQRRQALLIAVIQGQDADSAVQALTEAGFSVTRLPSAGAFLGRKNATLMIEVEQGWEETAVERLNNTCRQRVEFIAVPMENAPLPMSAPMPITIGGANIFSLEVEHFEEF